MMMRASLVLMAAAWAATAASQDSGSNIYETKFRHEKAIRKIPGVQDVSVGGVDGDLHVVVRVNGPEARDAVIRHCGEKLEGFPILFVVATAASPKSSETGEPAPCAACACPCHRGPGKTVAGPRKEQPRVDPERLDDRQYQVEQCDILREWMGLAKRDATNGIRCTQMVGWTNDPAKIAWIVAEGLPHWRSKEMPGLTASGAEVICYTYIKHRQFCPMGAKQILRDWDQLTPGK